MSQQLSKCARTLKYMVANGYRRDRALLVIQEAFALSPEAVVILDRLTR